MPFVAILGSGPLGGATAHKLAARDRVREVRLIDAEERVAQGKALDIRQASPVEGFTTQLTGLGSIAAVAGAAVIVVADPAGGDGEHRGEGGLSLLRQVAAMEPSAPIVFAGAAQRELMARSVQELSLPGARLVGSAPIALESALRSLAGVLIDTSAVEIRLRIVGVPPDAAVVAWEEASFAGQPLTAHLPPHQIAALNSRLSGLWPPGPYALASAASRVVEAMIEGSRRRFSCFVAGHRGIVNTLPVELGPDGIRRIDEPVLTRQERTRLDNAVEGRLNER
jgi:malate dehydrogenase